MDPLIDQLIGKTDSYREFLLNTRRAEWAVKQNGLWGQMPSAEQVGFAVKPVSDGRRKRYLPMLKLRILRPSRSSM